MRKVFLHVGYPKAFSTSLQRSFFGSHPEVVYGGIGVGDNISYANPDLEYVFECLLKYARRNFYLEKYEYARNVLNSFIHNFPRESTVVFSSEHLIFPFTFQHLDFYEVFQRIRELFKEYELHLLVVLRRQDTLLKSLYGEYIKMGYPASYSDFIQWVWAYRDRNFWEMLDYRTVLDLLSQVLPGAIIHVQYFEKLKTNPKEVINSEISKLLDISNINLEVSNYNPSLEIESLQALLELNKVQRRGMGEHMLTGFENHRNRQSFKRLKSGYMNDEIFQNVIDKRDALNSLGTSIPVEKHELFELSEVSTRIYRRMENYWKRTNLQLIELDTPDEYLTTFN